MSLSGSPSTSLPSDIDPWPSVPAAAALPSAVVLQFTVCLVVYLYVLPAYLITNYLLAYLLTCRVYADAEVAVLRVESACARTVSMC